MSFQFKKFFVADDRCGMKVGTDGVLLGAWVNVPSAGAILDIGTGSGLIALMLAQRTAETVVVDAIEIAEADAGQARENVQRSPWADKIRVTAASLQAFKPSQKYNLVVSNPPFFKSLLPAAHRRSARHQENLSHDELIECTSSLLEDDGRLAVILPTQEGDAFHALANRHSFFCIRSCSVQSTAKKSQERWLFEFSRTPGAVKKEHLVLQEGNMRTAAYASLTQDFYL